MRGERWFSLLSVGLLAALLVGLFGPSGFAPGAARALGGQAEAGPASEVPTPLGTAFTYQGQLKQDGEAVTAPCDFTFSLWDSLSEGTQISSTLTLPPVSVAGGLFTVELDFGTGAFQGDGRWLEIAVCCPSGCDPKVTLEPRQALTAAPYALALPGLWTQQNAESPNLVGGHSSNSTASGVYGATIGGGGSTAYPNRVTDNGGTVAGGSANEAGDNDSDPVTAGGATVGGGYGNTASGYLATVGGGTGNEASGPFATVGGGSTNTASGEGATVGGGWSNATSGYGATVGGGYGNTAGPAATVGGGDSNTASGLRATVGGGYHNTASGDCATVPGGRESRAEGDYSFAAGNYAIARNQGCFVWGDTSVSANVECQVDNQWVARSSGGVYFQTNSNGSTGVYVAAGGNAWDQISDRATKENFAPADGPAILEKLASLPVQEYNLKSQDDSIRHIGLVAQDFAVFGYGESDKAINTQDADGVAMAAIQALYAENQVLKAQVAGLDARLSAVEQAVAGSKPEQAGGRLPVPWLLGGGLVVAGGALAGRRRRPGGRP